MLAVFVGSLWGVLACNTDASDGDPGPSGEVLIVSVCGEAPGVTIYRDGDRVQLVPRDRTDVSGSGVLTENGRQQIASIEANVAPGTYDDCAVVDGCVVVVRLEAGDVLFCDEPEPEFELAELRGFVGDLYSALAMCDDDDLVTIDPGCVEAG